MQIDRYEHPDVIAWEKIELNGNQGSILSAENSHPRRDVNDDDRVTLDRVKSFALKQVEVFAMFYFLLARRNGSNNHDFIKKS